MPIRAVTFDFWRTLYRNSGSSERQRLRVNALVQQAGVDTEAAQAAMKRVMDEFLRIHVTEQRTLLPLDSISIIEQSLGRPLDPSIHGPLADAFAEAILEHPPAMIDGAFDAVSRTAARVPIAVISDTGISPGSSLEQLLKKDGLLDFFSTRAYSDRVGVSKPQAAMYEAAAAGLGCHACELLHIGDLEPTDIAGALRIGARAALFAGDNTRFADSTKAHHTFRSWREYLDQMDSVLSH